jgi:hypothetical protein
MRFTPTTCIANIDLMWEDVESFYELILSMLVLQSNALLKYPNLVHFLQSQNLYMWLKCIPLIGSELHQFIEDCIQEAKCCHDLPSVPCKQQHGMQDQPPTNKKNIMPKPTTQTKKATRLIKVYTLHEL